MRKYRKIRDGFRHAAASSRKRPTSEYPGAPQATIVHRSPCGGDPFEAPTFKKNAHSIGLPDPAAVPDVDRRMLASLKPNAEDGWRPLADLLLLRVASRMRSPITIGAMLKRAGLDASRLASAVRLVQCGRLRTTSTTPLSLDTVIEPVSLPDASSPRPATVRRRRRGQRGARP